MKDQPTCEDRIEEQLSHEIERIREALEDPDGDKYEEYMEGILAATPKIVFTVELSTGGPADGYRITIDPADGQIVTVEYYFHDWFDGAVRTLSGERLEAVEEMFDWLINKTR